MCFDVSRFLGEQNYRRHRPGRRNFFHFSTTFERTHMYCTNICFEGNNVKRSSSSPSPIWNVDIMQMTSKAKTKCYSLQKLLTLRAVTTHDSQQMQMNQIFQVCQRQPTEKTLNLNAVFVLRWGPFSRLSSSLNVPLWIRCLTAPLRRSVWTHFGWNALKVFIFKLKFICIFAAVDRGRFSSPNSRSSHRNYDYFSVDDVYFCSSFFVLPANFSHFTACRQSALMWCSWNVSHFYPMVVHQKFVPFKRDGRFEESLQRNCASKRPRTETMEKQKKSIKWFSFRFLRIMSSSTYCLTSERMQRDIGKACSKWTEETRFHSPLVVCRWQCSRLMVRQWWWRRHTCEQHRYMILIMIWSDYTELGAHCALYK